MYFYIISGLISVLIFFIAIGIHRHYEKKLSHLLEILNNTEGHIEALNKNIEFLEKHVKLENFVMSHLSSLFGRSFNTSGEDLVFNSKQTKLLKRLFFEIQKVSESLQYSEPDEELRKTILSDENLDLISFNKMRLENARGPEIYYELSRVLICKITIYQRILELEKDLTSVQAAHLKRDCDNFLMRADEILDKEDEGE